MILYCVVIEFSVKHYKTGETIRRSLFRDVFATDMLDAMEKAQKERGLSGVVVDAFPA